MAVRAINDLRNYIEPRSSSCVRKRAMHAIVPSPAGRGNLESPPIAQPDSVVNAALRRAGAAQNRDNSIATGFLEIGSGGGTRTPDLRIMIPLL
jgi:hypothetical protein